MSIKRKAIIASVSVAIGTIAPTAIAWAPAMGRR